MPAYGQSAFGATEGLGNPNFSPNTPNTSALQPKASSVEPTPLSKKQVQNLITAQSRRAIAGRAKEVNKGINKLKDLQTRTPPTKSQTWLSALTSVPEQYRPYVDDFTLNCMGSEGAIANAENYMYGLIELSAAKLGIAGEEGLKESSAVKGKLARYLATFGPAKEQVRKCGELMAALMVAANRKDRLTPQQYASLQEDLKYYSVR